MEKKLYEVCRITPLGQTGERIAVVRAGSRTEAAKMGAAMDNKFGSSGEVRVFDLKKVGQKVPINELPKKSYSHIWTEETRRF